MLRWRLISAAVILTAIISIIFADFQLGSADSLNRPGLVLGFVLMIVGCLAANEVVSFNAANNSGIKKWAVLSGTVLVIGFSLIPMFYENYPADCSVGRFGWPMFGMAATIGLAFVSQMIGYKPGDQVLDNVARTVMVVAYIGLLLSFWAPLRVYMGNAWGMVAMLSLFVTVKISDSMAYAIGRIFGKHKLAPNLSPGKTIEGMFGGLLGGCLGAFFVFCYLAPRITGEASPAAWWMIILFGVVVTLVGIVGDLSESLLKRDGGVKNSSRWLPGLGGIMDIIDSLLPAGPVVFAFWATGMFTPAA